MEIHNDRYKKLESAVIALHKAHTSLVARHDKLEREFITFKQYVSQNLCTSCAGNISITSQQLTGSTHRGPGISSPGHTANLITKTPTSNHGAQTFHGRSIDTVSKSPGVRPSPVQLYANPPTNVHRPQPNNQVLRQKLVRFTELCRSVKSRRVLLNTDEPQEKDFINVLRQIKVDVNPSTVAAVTSAVSFQSQGNIEWSRPAGLHTVLILDTSSSITDHGFNKMKTIVDQFLSSIENTEGQCEVYEYVSVITCGAETEIKQHFTNDYKQVKTVINRLTLNGRTPLMTAITLALFYLELQGENVMIDTYSILPRIIIISDFMLTSDQQPFDGHDDDYNDDRSQMSTRAYSFGSTCIKPHKYQITCIPVGNCNFSVAKQLANSCDGNIVSNDRDLLNVKMYYYFKVVGCCALSDYERNLASGNERNLDDIVDEYLSLIGHNQSYRDEVMNVIEKLQDEVSEFVDDIEQDARHSTVGNSYGGAIYSTQPTIPVLPDWNARSFDNISLEEIGGLPPLGTRVKRGGNWTSNNEDNNGPGTIIGHKDTSCIFVLWDNNEIGEYKFGVQGKYEVERTPTCRQVEMGDIDIGCMVTRGTDWNRGDEDGGSGTIGVVVRKLRGRCVQVRWPVGVIETYKFGAENKWEVQVTESIDESVVTNEIIPSSMESDIPNSMQALPTNTGHNEPTTAWWSWEDDSGNWRPFTEDSVRKLETKYSARQDRCSVQYKNKTVNVFMHELRCDIGSKRYKVKREMVKQEDIESLKTLESFLPPID